MALFKRKRRVHFSEESVSSKKTFSFKLPSWIERHKKLLLRIFIGLFATFTLILIGTFLYFAKDLPEAGNINKRFVAESTKIYDRTGNHLLYELHGEEKRTVIPFDQIPEIVRFATISLEDQDFYHHFGLKPTAILRAALKDIITLDAAQGGSTITQQFVKNSLLSNERTVTRKIKEAILSIEIETLFTKDEILAMYLNEIPYGQNAYGIEAASRTYFGKSAKELTLDEAALLASLPRGTAYYSPYGSRPERLTARKEYALKQMAKLGYITDEQAKQAIETDTLKKILPQKDIIAAPHFVMYIKDYLQEKYGDQSIEQGGYKVITTLDWDKQQAAEEAVREGSKNNGTWKASNAALVAMDPKNGQILAMVGSKDYFDTSIDGQVNVAIRNRQPGSSFKPYVYLTAFTKGYLPETMLYDTETEFDTNDGKVYKPLNYNGEFNGPISMKKALGGSLNIPAVKTLYLVGVKDSIKLAKDLGIQGLNDPDRVGLSLVLGGGEVQLLDHVNAYSTLATGGVRHEKTSILKIEDASGNILEEYQEKPGERVVEEKYVAMLDSILSNNENRAWVFGENSPLAFSNRQVAAKTGTTNEFRDGWTMGYTPNLAVGVWAGNNDNSPMKEGADGVNVAAPIWRKFMDKALSNYSIEKFPEYKPEDEIGEGENKTDKPMLSGKLDEEKDLKVCEIPGKDTYCLANKYCPDDKVKKKDFVSVHDILHYIDRRDPRGPIPDKPESDGQYKNWEESVKKWYEKSDNKDKSSSGNVPTKECEKGDFDNFEPDLKLDIPSSTNSSTLKLSVKTDAPYGIKKVTYSVDGDTIKSVTSKPYSTDYDIPNSKNNRTITIKAELEDDNGNTTTDSKDVSVSF
ncbi:MAG: PBP1A family penicillin-binding protein [Candidatus Moranbacteria bacterium]|nr:PBP1A family penicillin-binding protein [Candidatus Moranbacteria bacterium]